jgi:GTP-binding protein YchF
MLRLGLVGLPNVGKSTLFNALTNAGAPAENYPFCTVERNVGVVAVPDPRLARLAALIQPARGATPAFVEFYDIAGLVAGASDGEGLGNQFLAHIRDVDAIVHVARCFADPDVTHVMGAVDPVRDHDVVTTELALADLALLERRHEKVMKTARSGVKEDQEEAAFLERVIDAIGTGRRARDVATAPEHAGLLRQLGVLTAKPVLYAANVADGDLPGGGPAVEALRRAVRAQHEAAEVVVFSARFEAELQQLAPDDRAEFLASAGLAEPGLDRLIHAGYRLLGLETFFTANENEVRAWTLRAGSTAYEAAGAIHSDFQRGFIRCETLAWDQLIAAGSYKAAREHALIRSEGRDYPVRDGDVLLFRFNV